MLSDKAIALINNTIIHTRAVELEGKIPFFTEQFWVEILKNPRQYKKLVKQIEEQASRVILREDEHQEGV